MKLLRYGPAGAEKPGLLDGAGVLRDLSGEVDDIAGDVLLPDSLARLGALDPATLPEVSGSPRMGPCIGRVVRPITVYSASPPTVVAELAAVRSGPATPSRASAASAAR